MTHPSDIQAAHMICLRLDINLIDCNQALQEMMALGLNRLEAQLWISRYSHKTIMLYSKEKSTT